MLPPRPLLRAVFVLAAACVLALLPSGAAGDDGVPSRAGEATDATQAAQTVRVGIKPLDPFVVRSGTQYSGFSIELWDEIAKRNGWTTSYVWYDTLPPLLDEVSASRLDVGIAGISITHDRESRMDFSHPMFNAGLQVIAEQRNDDSWLSHLRGLASPKVGLYLLVLVVAILIAGNVVWFLERRHEDYVRGVGHGMFRVAGVGLVGDLGEPGHSAGEMARVVWAVIGICFVSAFTASLTTELTVKEITGGIRSVNDLVDKRVVTVRGTTAAQYLTDRRIDFDGVDTVEDAFARLDDGRADAMVFDSPVLHHHIEETGSERLALIGNVFQREEYGIALPAGSALRKPVNRALLEMRADGTYDRIYEYYFGKMR
jgi:polar amino acid transport system substrate-binding protein